MARIINGVALTPQVSLNGVFYWPQEMEKFDGVTVPLRYEHDKSEKGIIGEVTFTHNKEKARVEYIAKITDEIAQKLPAEKFQTSIGAQIKDGFEHEKICHPEGKGCFRSPVLKAPTELSLVASPGIPATTVNVVEQSPFAGTTDYNYFTSSGTHIYEKDYISLPTSFSITSDIDESENKSNMVKDEKPNKVEEAKTEETQVEESKTEVKEAKTEAKSETKVEECKDEKVAEPIEQSVTIESVKEISKNVGSEIAEKIAKEIRENWKSESEVEETNGKFVDETYSEDDAEKIVKQVIEGGHYRAILNKEDWITARKSLIDEHGTVMEASVGSSGTIPTVKATKQIVIDNNGESLIPLRQFGKFELVGQNQNKARFFSFNLKTFGSFSGLGPSTSATATTSTLTSYDCTVSSRGIYHTVKKDDIEEFPAAFMNSLRETIRLGAIADEHQLIVTTLGATSNAQNGKTGTTYPYHIAGDDGAAVTNDATETSVGALKKAGIVEGRKLLKQLGAKGRLALITSEQGVADLLTDTSITTWLQDGDPGLTREANLSRVVGVDILVSEELVADTSSTTKRGIMFEVGQAWGLGSQRNLEIELQKQIKGQYIDVVGSHKIGVTTILKKRYCLISSTA